MDKNETVAEETVDRNDQKESGKEWLTRLNSRTVAWYASLELIGVLMYIVAAVYAYHQRGYFAIGGRGHCLHVPSCVLLCG